jgi:N-acetylmuramoyl-L-alanine amidase
VIRPSGVAPIWHPSPNFGERRGTARPELVVLHYTAMAGCAAARDRLCDPLAEVSAHYLIGADGTVLQLVDEDARAWHAGAGEWRGRGDVNSRSIGIELDNPGGQPFAAAQMRMLERLLEDILGRWSMGPEAVIAHSDMAPERKGDPGARFDWRRLALAGLSVWPEGAEPCAPRDFFAAACRFGYPQLDETVILHAFRLRFRPWATGPLDDVDAGMMINLAQRFPAI